MKTLHSDFCISLYGIDCRMVNMEDVDFILKLRTNPKLNKFMRHTENDKAKQILWMEEYFKRNQKGEDYYFVYSYKGEPFGVSRISNIHNEFCTGGSWICDTERMESSIASFLLSRYIIFEIMEFERDEFDVQVGNKSVRKLHVMMGAKPIGFTDNQENFVQNKADYLLNKNKLLKFIQ